MPRSTMNTDTPAGLLVLFKGDSGVGKSVGAYSFPNAYVFDFDRKMPGIARKHFPGKDISYDVFDDIFQVSEQLNQLNNYCPYETLIADSFTSLANLTIESVGKVKGESVPEMLKKVQVTQNKNKQLEMMPIDYYGGEDRFCNFFVNQLKRLQSQSGNPKYVIVIAHVLTVESAPDLKTKLVTRTKSIVSKGRKVAAWLPTEFDNVWSFEIEKDPFGNGGQGAAPKRMCYTEAYDEDSAKCALAIPSKLDFSTTSLFDCIFKRAEFPTPERA